MKNKILLAVVVLLIPNVVISFYHKKTNFYLESNVDKKEVINNIFLKDKNEYIPLNDYIVGVVAAEMPALFESEALKAQAVVARTFALYQMKHNGYVTLGDQAYITIDDMKNKWSNDFEKYYHKIKQAVDDTGNICIQYQNSLIKSYYFAVSNGSTEDSKAVFGESYDYLIPVISEQDLNTSKYLSEVNIDINEFKSKLNVNNLADIHIKKDKQNYVEKIIIANHELSGIQFRKLFNLKSASFDLEVFGDHIKITCYGYGHGVGMSQYGANELAKVGYTYQDIINYYYRNVEISEYYV